MRKHLTSIDLEKIRTEVSTAGEIWVDDFFSDGSNLVRQITSIRTNDMRLCQSRKDQQKQIDHVSSVGRHPSLAIPRVIGFKQYKIDGNGSVIEKRASYGSSYVKAFMRWVNTPPKPKTKKCSHCNGTGRVPHEEETV